MLLDKIDKKIALSEKNSVNNFSLGITDLEAKT
jgi:hypothetical protein